MDSVLQKKRRWGLKNNNGAKKKVLLVDDEEKVLKFTELKLKLSGYEVITALNGKDALKLVQSEKPDIMLLDILMPVMDGFEALSKLRAFSDIPVIVLTAKTGVYEQAKQMGANDFLLKPFNPDDLVSKIHDLLNEQAVVPEE